MAERPAPSIKPVAQKLLLKPGARAAVLHAPSGYLDQFPKDVTVDQALQSGGYDFVQLFAMRKQDLLNEGPKVKRALRPAGLLWVSYPKGKALPTDLNRDIVAATLQEVGLQVVTQVA